MVRIISSILLSAPLAFWAATAPAQNWLETNVEIGQLVDAGAYETAAELGPELIAQAIDEFGDDSEQLAESYMILAEIEMSNRDWIAAEDNIVLAIQAYERFAGPIATELIVPYSNLGDAYLLGKEYVLAIRAYNQARGITRRHFGLNTALQVPMVYRESAAVEALGDIDTAVDLQIEAVQITQRYFGVVSQESLDGLIRLADWFSRHDRHVEAGNQYRNAGNLLRSGLEGDDLDVIRLLRLAAENYRLGALELNLSSGAPAPSTLYTALNLAIELEGGGTELLQAEIWRDIGDWYVAFPGKERIADAYLNSINLLASLENGEQLISEWFTQATPIYRGSLRAKELSDADDALTGTVELEFLIRSNGTIDKIEVIASNPEGLLDREAKRRMDNSRFRPIFENGQIVEAVRTYLLAYRYDPDFAED